MAILKNAIIKEIQDTIENSNIFSKNDFKFEFPDTGNILAHIQYRASKQYSFSIEEDSIKKTHREISSMSNIFSGRLEHEELATVFRTKQKPGKHKNEEKNTHGNIDECISEIRNWLYHLDTDLKNEIDFDIENISDSDIDDFEVKLDEKFPNEKEKFTDVEKEDLFKKLDELQKRIEQLEQNAHSKKVIDIIEQSKNELATYPKKSWWLKLYNKVHGINQGANLAIEFKNNIGQLWEIVDNILK